MLQKATALLRKLDQTHLIRYMETLEPDMQSAMAAQIADLDLSVLNAENASDSRGYFEPLYATTLDKIAANRERYTETGLEAIRAGKVGAVMLAGGQGSRLGFEKPKGTFNIGLTRELYIFECLIGNLLEVTNAAGAFVPLFIMTSAENDSDTREFFEQHNYFGYDSSYVWFFVQEQFPATDTDGRLLLAGPGKIATAPNGNGGWYASMEKNGMLDVIRERGIEWLNVFAMDNVLQRIADPCFVGAVIASGMASGAKVVAKTAPDEKVGVICLEDGRPSIVEYYEMTDEMRSRREPDGTLSYNYGVILNYLFRVDKLDETLHVRLPLHKALKKLRYMTEDGRMIVPEEPNAFKFETLALDMVKLQENCLAYEVDRSREFAPIKNKTGVDSVDTARALLRSNGVIL
ncbi:MAG: UTP--glucose-1-phosphate uridylyltransferase [Oscillospiraceae bacterium]|nr:UTP--glucose-1-phosphate uridylyltransferase [Oscillospiraceae bacterium]